MLRVLPALTLGAVIAVSANAGPSALNTSTVPGPGGTTDITAEIWVDNWFALHVNGELVLEDSTPYETERSFNAERVTFRADLPMNVAFELRDFMQNDTGLEYIGGNRQQMGDGGAIFQFHDAAGRLIGVSDAGWRCEVVHHAPVDTACADASDPVEGEGVCASVVQMVEGWTEPAFDDSAWPFASIHSEADVGPKSGYDEVTWDDSATLIWGRELKQDNIVLCRAVLE